MSGADTVAATAEAALSGGAAARRGQMLVALLLLGTALAPLNTKVAGVAWLVLCVLGFWLGLRGAGPRRVAETRPAATAWLLACLVATGAWASVSWLWNEPCCAASADLSSGLRLLVAALASWLLTRQGSGSAAWRQWTNAALAAACVAALALVLLVGNRSRLPSNAIPWAVAVSFLVCLLWPSALDPRAPTRSRWLWGAGAAAGLVAVVLSGSRGAYALLLWLPLLAGVAALHRLGRLGKRIALAMVLASVALLGALASLPADPLRFQKAWQEVDHALKTEDYNSSLGARVFVFQLAWQGFKESPWIGLGATESVRRIKTAGEDLPAPEAARFEHVRTLGHAHNQYLHQAMTGGLLGLGGLLALFLGMAVSAGLLWRNDRIAGLQMAGVWAMHAAGSLSNVNLAHNYYAVMLALAVGLVLLNAGRNQPAVAVPVA